LCAARAGRGRLVYQKGVNILIGAMPGIVVSSGSSVNCDVKLVIVGEG